MSVNSRLWELIKLPHHGQRFLSLNQSFDVGNNFFQVVVRHFRAPPCAYAFRTVDEHHGYDRQVIDWLDGVAVFEVSLQNGIITLAKKQTCETIERRVDVTRIRRILAC